MNILTLDDFKLKDKTIFLRVDMNCPIDPETMEISGTKRIEEATETIESLGDAKLVVASHQGRVGNKDYTGMEKHAKVLEKFLNRDIKYVQDVIGSAAKYEIESLKNGEILLLDNLRLCAEENYEFISTLKKIVLSFNSKSSSVRMFIFFLFSTGFKSLSRSDF